MPSYKSAVDFRPRALQVLAGKQLPAFQGGMDAGIRRRVLVVAFNRTIPLDERIEDIGRRIAEDEADGLLAWAVAGASRVLARGGFPDLLSSREAISEWVASSDCVGAWLRDQEEVAITGNPADIVQSKDAFRHFAQWCGVEGVQRERIPPHAQFTHRVNASGIRGLEPGRTSRGRCFKGMRISRRGHEA
jgi:putative DNA primase/helicase